MGFVADSPSAGGRFVPDSEVLKGVKAEDKPPPPLSDRIGERIAGIPREAVRQGAGLGEAALNMGTGMVAKPASDLAGLATLLGKIPGARNNTGFDPADVQRKVQEAMTYQPRTPAGQQMSQYNPIALIAKLFGKGGEAANRFVAPPETSGPLRAALGSGLEEGIKEGPAFLGIKAPPAVTAVADAMKEGKYGARGFMQSALKPDAAAQRTGKAGKAIDTLLEDGTNVSKGGADAMRTRIEGLNDRIGKMIDGSPAVIDKQHVGYYVQSAIDKFKNQVDKAPDVAAIQGVWDRFLKDFDIPDKIPVKQAQELKQGTHRALGGKAYGELKGAEVEAQKALARGLKEEIARAVPAVRALNAEESKLLNALSLVEKRVLMEANKNPGGLGWLTTSPEKFALWMADRSPLFKSIVARMLNTGSEALRPLASEVVPAAGVAASQDRQIPAPPK